MQPLRATLLLRAGHCAHYSPAVRDLSLRSDKAFLKPT